MLIAFINRPNGDFTFSGGLTGNAARRLPARPAGAVPPHDRATPARTATAGSTPATSQDEFRLGVEPDAEPRRALRAAAAVRRRATTRSTRFHPGAAVDAVPGRAGRPGLSGRRRRAARHLRDRQEQLRAARSAWPGIVLGDGRTQPAGGVGHLLRRARRPGRLLPERRAGAAVHAAARGELAAGADHAARSADGGHRRRQPVPARADHHRLGRGVRDAVRAALQRRRGSRQIGAALRRRGRLRRLARQATCRSSWRSIRASTRPGRPRRGARLLPAFALVRPTFSVAESWYDSLQASLRMRPTRGLNFLASYTLGHAHRPRVGPEHRRRVAAGAAGGRSATRRRSTRRSTLEKGDALFDVRHRFVVSFGAELPTPGNMGDAVRHIARRLAAERHRPGADRVPVHGHRRAATRHPLPDQPAEPDLRSERGRAAHHRAVVQHRAASSAGRWPANRRALGNAGRNRCAARASSGPTCRSSRTSTSPAAHRIQLRVEAFNLFNQARFGHPGGTIGTATFGRITQAEDGRIMQLAIKYSF